MISEFSLLRLSSTKLLSLIEREGSRADKLSKVFKKFNLHISSLQVGISITTMLIGYLGIRIFSSYMNSIFEALSFPTGNGFIKFLEFIFTLLFLVAIYAIFAEITPKMITVPRIEEIAFTLAPFIFYYNRFMKVFTIPFRRTSQFILTLVRQKPTSLVYKEVFSEDELKMIIADSKAEGQIDETEHMMIERVLDFTDTTAKEILTPRYKIIAFPITAKAEEILGAVKETGFSRFPIYEDDLDNIKGFVHIKDLLVSDVNSPDFSMSQIMRNVVTVHEGMLLDVLLKKMQQRRAQMAILVDEYGSVEGLVTIEDVIEEIVGEIDDEFDDHSAYLETVGDNAFRISGDLPLDQFNSSFSVDFEGEDAVTIAGFLLAHMDTLPEVGSKIKIEPCEFEVTEMDGNRIAHVLAKFSKKVIISPEGEKPKDEK